MFRLKYKLFSAVVLSASLLAFASASDDDSSSSSSSSFTAKNIAAAGAVTPFKKVFWDREFCASRLVYTKEEAIKIAKERVAGSINHLNLFMDQINNTNFNKVEGGLNDENYCDAKLTACTEAIYNFLAAKIKRANNKLFDYQIKLEATDHKKFNQDNNYFKNYSGQYSNDEKSQSEYALKKYLAYNSIKNFIKIYRLGPVVINPIIASLIRFQAMQIEAHLDDANRCLDSHGFLNDSEKHKGFAFTAVTIEKDFYVCNIGEADTFAYFINTRTKKWLNRILEDQKPQIFMSKKSLPELLAEFVPKDQN